MNKGFVNITRDEFVAALPIIEAEWKEGTIGKECIYSANFPNNLSMVIYSSIGIDGESRSVGSDAIRCVILDAVSGKPLGKAIRTNRVEGWSSRLNEKVYSLFETIVSNGIARCPNCLSVVVERDGKRGKFWGCLAYPDCKFTSESKPKNVGKAEGFMRLLSERPSMTIGQVCRGLESRSDYAGFHSDAILGLTKDFEFLGRLNWIKSRTGDKDKAAHKRLANKYLKMADIVGDFDGENREKFFDVAQQYAYTQGDDGAKFDYTEVVLIEAALTIKSKSQRQGLIVPKVKEPRYEMVRPLGMDTLEPLVPTSNFKWMNFDFEHFNPVQSKVYPFIETDSNIVVASPTASGKTVVAEMVISYMLLNGDDENSKAIYLAPMKALSEEKIADFTNDDHSFSGLNISIMTGDYQMTSKKLRELQRADIVIMTNEMLATRSRMINSEKNDWLMDVKVVIVDEAHLIAISGRGDSTESALMMFTKINPDARVIFLSATMPNSIELAEWLQLLNGKKTAHVSSEYRPCKVEKHYIKLRACQTYGEMQSARMEAAMEIIREHPSSKFLVFSGTKTWGYQFLEYLTDEGFDAAFHNADRTRDERAGIEADFRDPNGIKILVSTTTNAWGVNLPARRVIIANQSFGLEEMPVADVIQMIGRSGRPKYDTHGDAYVLIDERRYNYWVQKIEEGEDIKSLFGQLDVLEFHALAEICNDNVNTVEDFYEWYSRSLAHLQDIIPVSPSKVIESLRKYGCIYLDGDLIKPTMLGKIAFWFYFTPRLVAQWRRNLDTFNGRLGDSGEVVDFIGSKRVKYSIKDIAMAMIVCHRVSNKGFIARNEREKMTSFRDLICSALDYSDFSSEVHPTYQEVKAFLLRVNGIEVKGTMNMLQRQIAYDFGRVSQAIKLIANMVVKVDIEVHINAIDLRLRYGVEEELISLVSIKGIGGVIAMRLYKAGIKNREQLIDELNFEAVVRALKSQRRAQTLIDNTLELDLEDE